MSTRSATSNPSELHYISTDHLPSTELVTALVREAYQRFKNNTDSKNSDVYPALARVPRDEHALNFAAPFCIEPSSAVHRSRPR